MKQGYYGLGYFLLVWCFLGGGVGCTTTDAMPNQSAFAVMGSDGPTPKRRRTQSLSTPISEADEAAPGAIFFCSMSLEGMNSHFIQLFQDLKLAKITRESLFASLYKDKHQVLEALHRVNLDAPLDKNRPLPIHPQLSPAEKPADNANDTVRTLRIALHHITAVKVLFATGRHSVAHILEALAMAGRALEYKSLLCIEAPSQIEAYQEIYGYLYMKLLHHKSALQIKEARLHHDDNHIRKALAKAEELIEIPPSAQ